MRATEHVEILSALPEQPPLLAELCKHSLHRTVAHFVACQRSWLPLLQAIIDCRTWATVKPHPIRLMEESGLLQAEWYELISEHKTNAQRWEEMVQLADPMHKLTVAHRTWTAQELTDRLIGHERHHLAEHNLVTLDN